MRNFKTRLQDRDNPARMVKYTTQRLDSLTGNVTSTEEQNRTKVKRKKKNKKKRRCLT